MGYQWHIHVLNNTDMYIFDYNLDRERIISDRIFIQERYLR